MHLTAHSGHTIEQKEEFYDQLSTEVSRIKGRFLNGGGFNARIHYVRDNDIDGYGPHIISRGTEYLDNMNEYTKENRALFLGLCKLHRLQIANNL